MSFESLGLQPALNQALSEAGYTTATPVQLQAIPPAMTGRDLRVSSQTGSGKTASFMLPALNKQLLQGGKAKRLPRMLVLAPTRELAQQVAEAAYSYGRHVRGLRVATIVGGVPYGLQLKALRGPCDIIIATPGRLMDLMQSGNAVLSNIDTFVLDEADRMLDLGFIDDIHHIAQSLPAEHQTMMYSATFGGRVGALADDLQKDALRIEVSAQSAAHADIEQRLHWADDLRHKNALLEHLLTDKDMEQALIFTSTQRDADWLADHLAGLGHSVASLHGGMPQGRRNRVLNGLRDRHLRVLVATDVAARGIDVPTISHVINYGLPMKAEDYVHRIGRTGRAGRSGLAVTLAERRDSGMVQRIQRFTTQRIPPSVIAGLEPKRMEEPSRAPFKPKPGYGKPSFGQPGFGKPNRYGKGKGAANESFHNEGPRAMQPSPHNPAQRGDPRFDQPQGQGGRPDFASGQGPRQEQPRGPGPRPFTSRKPFSSARRAA
jgi:superfamily II DNA/RNA helicase